jgi:NADH:ubiquinone oxidoreductase subunit 5 (subunit L)/multisubunit Na+/H+ antiporter MnhA subunit
VSAAFLLIAAGAFSRIGAVPFQGWLPRAAQSAPPAVMAVGPAALNVILGGYLLARAGLFVFDLGAAVGVRTVLTLAGAVTAVLGAAAAGAQRDLRRLLACLLFGQAGYMLVGLAGGTAAAAGGALLHVLSTVAGMGLLFLTLGAIERRVGTADLTSLGGMGRRMPYTLAAMLVGALAVSGVPLFSGFMSRWLLCAGMLEGAFGPPAGSPYEKIFTVAALLAVACVIFACVLTLVVLLRAMHALFLGRPGTDSPAVRPAPASMRLPMYCLSLVCLALGVCPHWLVHNPFLVPIAAHSQAGGAWLPPTAESFALPGGGFWSPLLAAALLLGGLLALGALSVLAGWTRIKAIRPVRGDGGFRPEELGGAPAVVPEPEAAAAVEAEAADRALLDPAERLGALLGRLAQATGLAHDGSLSSYLGLAVLGLVIIVAALLLSSVSAP